MPPHDTSYDISSSTLSEEKSPSLYDTDNRDSTINMSPENEIETNGSKSIETLPLYRGIYAPTLAFFDPVTEDVDIPTIKKHAVRLANAGLTGLVTQGSNGEAVHLSHKERCLITSATREALDEAGYKKMPVIVGCGAQSVRETIELCEAAFESGGSYAMVLPPCYYGPLYTAESQFEFFTEVADKSPIPIIIYNYPGAVSGIDLNSDVLIRLSNHPNITGCKLTCGNTGKLARVESGAQADFYTFAGSCDFTLQSLVVRGHGVIGGTANVAPYACKAVYDLYVAGRMMAAEELQAIVARGDWVCIKGGVVATKSILQSYFGYGGRGRKPLPQPTEEQAAGIMAEIEELMLLEESLQTGLIHSEKDEQFPQLSGLECDLERFYRWREEDDLNEGW